MARDCVDRAGTKTPGEGACAACAKKHQTCLEIPRFYYVAYATWTRATDAEAVDAAKGLKTMLKAAKALTEVKPGSLLLAGIATDLALSVHLVMSGVRFLSVGSFVAVLRLGSGVFWLGFCSTSTEADASLGSGQSRGDGERVPGNENLLSVLDLQIALAREMEPQTTRTIRYLKAIGSLCMID